MIEVSTAVEDHLLDSPFKALPSNEFPHFLRCFYVAWIFETPFKFRAQCGSTHQGRSSRILNGLYVDMF
jgi:hypothetical protein